MKKLREKIAIVLVISFLLLAFYTPQSVVVKAENTKEIKWASSFSELVDEYGFVNGINVPWFDSGTYGKDIGRSVQSGYNECKFDENIVIETLMNCKAAGYDIINLWLTEHNEGILFDDNGTVVGVEPDFKKNLEYIYQKAMDLGLYISICINSHNEDIAGGNPNKTKWDKYRQFIYRPEQTKYYLENWLTPIIEMTKDYPNVLLVDLFREPEAETGFWSLCLGTTWENMCNFLNSCSATVRKVNPNLEIYCSAASYNLLTEGYYDNLDIDYNGLDTYRELPIYNPKDMFLKRPLIFGEYSTSTSQPSTQEYMSYYVGSFLDQCVEYGVKSAFFWFYGAHNGEGTRSITDQSGKLSPFTISNYFWSLDRKYERENYDGMDAPSICYSTESGVRFIGSRTAEKYHIERSLDKNSWTKVKTVETECDEKYADYLYDVSDETAKQGKTYYYRVIAEDEQGQQMASNISNAIVIPYSTCSEEDNLIKDFSFEKGLVDPNGYNGWSVVQGNSEYPAVYITDGVAGDNVHSGKSGYFQIFKNYQQLTLEPNTDYTFSFWFKATGSENDPIDLAYWYFGINILTSAFNVSGSELNSASNEIKINGIGVASNVNQIRIPNRYKDGKWHLMTYTFNSGDFTNVRLQFSQYNIQKRLDWYLDDVYLFKTPQN